MVDLPIQQPPVPPMSVSIASFLAGPADPALTACTQSLARVRDSIFYLREWGGPPSPPLLCLHGAGHTATCFDKLAPALSLNSHVVAFDQRDTGRSHGPKLPHYQPSQFVRDVGAIADHLCFNRFTIVGSSLGGLQGMAYSALDPSRVGALVLIDILPTVNWATLGKLKEVICRRFESREDIERYLGFSRSATPAEVSERVEQDYVMLPDGAWGYRAEPYLASYLDKGRFEHCWKYLELTRCPVLLLKGALSNFVPPSALSDFQRLPGVRELVIVPRAGHAAMLDNPAFCAARIQSFLHEFWEKA